MSDDKIGSIDCAFGLEDPEVIRYLAKGRAKDLRKARSVYEERLERARDKYDDANDALVEARQELNEARRALVGLPEEIAHLEAVSESENATFEMLTSFKRSSSV